MGRSYSAFIADLERVRLRDGQVVWKERIFDSDDRLEGYYTGPEGNRFPWMWERRRREKMGGLAAALGAQPAPLPPGLVDELREDPPPAIPPTMGIDTPAGPAGPKSQ